MAFSATGGTKTVDGDYTVHKFVLADTGDYLECTGDPSLAEVLVVGGGGGGASGGGGGGGFVAGAVMLTGSMLVTVGDGGLGKESGTASGDSGGDSVFGPYTALGGGGGGKSSTNGSDGASGGGSGYHSSAQIYGGGLILAGQGNAGGGNANYRGSPYPAGGGGGAGSIGGGATSSSAAGAGGSGLDSDIEVADTQVGYCGGGGGGIATATTGFGTATDGGGNGSGSNVNASAGTSDLGGGGGGAGSGKTGGNGGSGVIIIRYLTGGEELSEDFSATGGDVTYDNLYTVRRFTTSGTLECTGSIEAEILVVGGGGGGASGGGGAGGYLTSSTQILSGTMNVVVGAGGSGGEADTNTATNGSGSSFGALFTAGGGHGGIASATSHAGPGGSGGGAGGYVSGSNHSGGAATPSGQGNIGGNCNSPQRGQTPAAGGGGAAAVGGSPADPSDVNAGAGGAGYDNDIVEEGVDVGYAGGGGGGVYTKYGAGNGGSATHGGAAGKMRDTGAPANATANTGGGGGGYGYGGNGSNGGTGIVIIRYLTPASPVNEGAVTLPATTATGSGGVFPPYTETIDGDYTVRVYDTPSSGLFHAPFGWQSWMTAEVLLVGGGGGAGTSGGESGGGGGGAGGYVVDASVEGIEDGDIITVGSGGAAGANGTATTFAGLTAYGGEYGSGPVGGDSGSGTYGHYHGGSYYAAGPGENTGGGGGGGSDSVGGNGLKGVNPTPGTGGAGGAGLATDITGTSLTYAVGGTGGIGLGASTPGADGTDGRGNGGDGGIGGGIGGAGGDGTLIIRFITPLNSMHVSLGSPRATGTAWVSAAYSGVGRVETSRFKATGVVWNQIFGFGRAQIGPAQIAVGIACPAVYLSCGAKVYVAASGVTVVTGMSANCRVSVAGEEDWAWLRDTGEIVEMEAGVRVRVAERGDTLLNTASLPATDALGWTAADRDIPYLRGLVVTLGGKRVSKNLIADLVIDLSDRGGYDRATLVLDKSVRVGQAAMLSTLRVTYKGSVLFRGRLEARGPALGHDMQHALTFTGPIAQLKDHRGFRRVYCDSDLSSWQTSQGPNTSANVFEVEAG